MLEGFVLECRQIDILAKKVGTHFSCATAVQQNADVIVPAIFTHPSFWAGFEKKLGLSNAVEPLLEQPSQDLIFFLMHWS